MFAVLETMPAPQTCVRASNAKTCLERGNLVHSIQSTDDTTLVRCTHDGNQHCHRQLRNCQHILTVSFQVLLCVKAGRVHGAAMQPDTGAAYCL